MTFQKFPNYMYEIVNLGGETEQGTYTVSESGELSNLVATMIFYRTDLFTTERFRLRLVRSNAPSTPVYSDWVSPVDSIDNFLGSNYWLGDVRLDFDKQQMTGATTFQVFLETENYTHDYSGTQIGSILHFIDNATGQFQVIPNTANYQSNFLYR